MATVINGGPQLGPQWQNDLSSAIQRRFTALGTETKILTISPLALDENAYFTEITAYAPDAVLLIKAIGGTKDPFGGMLEIQYDASLLTPDLNKRIWRAAITSSGGTAMITMRMDAMAESIITKMQSDGIFIQ